MAVSINQGTQTSIKTTTDSGAEIQHVRVDGGTSIISVGTISKLPSDGTVTQVTTVSNLTNGTVRISVGTVSGGTLQNINFGTIDTFYRHVDEWATTVNTGTNTLGTIKPLVSGSSIYVTDFIVSAGSATNVEIASGGTSTPILGTLHFSANGGAVMNFRTPIRTAAGSALVYKQSSAISPLTITAQGYVD